MKNLNLNNQTSKQDDNFDTLDLEVLGPITELAVDTANSLVDGLDHYQDDVKELISSIEYESRDGFWANADNRGGLLIRLLTTVGELVGSGNHMGFNDSAIKEIERQYGVGLEYALEGFKVDHADDIKGIPLDRLNYHDLYELGRGDLAEKLSELESESNNGDNESIMIEIRMMYHGEDRWSVSAVINTEGPYHRQSISWAKEIKCEHGKEFEVKTSDLRKTVARLMASELGITLERGN